MKKIYHYLKQFISKIFKKKLTSTLKPYDDGKYKGVNHHYLD